MNSPARHRSQNDQARVLRVSLAACVALTALGKVFSEGTLERTRNELDVAIAGDGFLQFNLPDGEPRYTRDGVLRLDSRGNIVNREGYLVQPPITLPRDVQSVSIGTDGTVSVFTAGFSTSVTTVGTLTLVRFPNPVGLSNEGNNFYSETAASGSPIFGIAGSAGFGTIRQGFLEKVSVEFVSRLVMQILAFRA